MPEQEHQRGFDPERIVRVLAAHDVAYVLLGGVAARLHGATLLTQDVDILPDTAADNLARLAAALREMDARLGGVPDVPEGLPVPLDERTFASSVMRFTTRYGDVDVLRETLSRGRYGDLRAAAEEIEVVGVRVAVADLDDIIADKEASGRVKDTAQLPHLYALRKVAEEDGPVDVDAPPGGPGRATSTRRHDDPAGGTGGTGGSPRC